MNAFEIIGGNKLKGEIIPQGAKNEALQVICAVLLTPEKVTISNIPNIKDVMQLITILQEFGVKVEQINENTYTFQSDEVDIDYITSEAYKNRGSYKLHW